MEADFIRINKYSSIPLYEQLEACLVKAMRGGLLKPGQKLPTEDEICRQFGISRPVVRQAYNNLVKDGMLERKRGRGSFVRSMEDRGIFIMRLMNFSEEMEAAGMKPGTDLKKMEEIPFDLDIFGKLNLERGQHCLHLERMRYADGQPFTYIENYIPMERFPGIEKHDYNHESLYKVMKEEYGIYPIRAVRSMRAEIIKPSLAPLLHVERKGPIHLIESITFDQFERPMEYSLETYPGNTHRFDFVVYND